MKGYLYTDGGARGNPGPAATGAVLKDENDNIIDRKGTYLGISTNNVAEYEALVLGLNLAVNHKIKNLECYLDSELIVKQLTNIYKVKNENLKKIYLRVKELEKRFEIIEYKHVKRHLNKEADAIVNIVLDTKANG